MAQGFDLSHMAPVSITGANIVKTKKPEQVRFFLYYYIVLLFVYNKSGKILYKYLTINDLHYFFSDLIVQQFHALFYLKVYKTTCL
jgi:hypothetical protein